MNNLTIEQAAANLESLLNQTALKRLNTIYCIIVSLLFTTAKATQEVKEDEKICLILRM